MELKKVLIRKSMISPEKLLNDFFDFLESIKLLFWFFKKFWIVFVGTTGDLEILDWKFFISDGQRVFSSKLVMDLPHMCWPGYGYLWEAQECIKM